MVFMLFCMWMAREPLAGLIPDEDTLFIWLGVVAFVAIAAVPLAVRDYFSNGGLETVWLPTEGCVEAAAIYSAFLINGDIHRFYSSLPAPLQSQLSNAGFACNIKAVTNRIGFPVSVAAIEEIEIPEHVFPDPDCDSEIDCIVQIAVEHFSQHRSMMVLYLNFKESFQLVNVQFGGCETYAVNRSGEVSRL